MPAQLGRLVVPRNRSRQGSQTIELAFVKLPAIDEAERPPVIYLAGGPGGSGIEAGRGSRFELFDALRKTGDVILLDQRGTGRSTLPDPEECPITRTYPLDRPIELEPYLELVEEVGRACRRYWEEHGVDLSAYDTVESVADLEALRRALGAERIDLLGISYGTHLALAYMRHHPDRVRRAVLAGVEGPDHTVKGPEQFDAQLRRLEELVANEEPDGLDPLRERIETLLDRLSRQPVTLRIVQVEGRDKETTLVVGRRGLAELTMDLLRDPATMVQVPQLFERLAGGDFTDVAGTLLGMRTIGGLQAMPEAMDAASGISRGRLERLRSHDAHSLLGSGLLEANVALAQGLGVEDLGTEFREPVTSDVPTLFISGSLDGRTPVSNALEVMKGFSEAQHLVVENGGHGDDLLVGTPELAAAIVDFFAGRKRTPPRVVLPAPRASEVPRRIGLSEEEAARYTGEYERRPREIWRILHNKTVETLGREGEVLSRNATLQIRWNGDGFPFHPTSERNFFIDFPWFLGTEFRFELDASGAVTHLSVEDGRGDPVRMEKVH
ncbi:MAG: alpha/beta hydrolase [Thermoanaerobaculia bacterium]